HLAITAGVDQLFELVERLVHVCQLSWPTPVRSENPSSTAEHPCLSIYYATTKSGKTSCQNVEVRCGRRDSRAVTAGRLARRVGDACAERRFGLELAEQVSLPKNGCTNVRSP